MERNTFLAVALMFIVVILYPTMFPAPKHVVAINGTQINATQTVTDNSAIPTEQATVVNENTTSTIKKSIVFSTNLHNNVFSYTNVGGSLHKIDFNDSSPFPLKDVLSINGYNNSQFTSQQIDDKTISFRYSDKDLEIKKTYQIQDDNTIKVRMEIKNLSSMSILNNPSFSAFDIDQSTIDPKNNREMGLNEYSVYAGGRVVLRKDNAVKFDDKNYKNVETSIEWVGFRDHYNALIIHPEFKTKAFEIKSDSNTQLNIALLSEAKSLKPGEASGYDFTLYAGPQDPVAMKKAGHGFEKIIVFSKYPIYEWPAQVIYYLLFFFHYILKSWGVAIILLGFTFYAATYPLTIKTMTSMRKMQEVGPRIKAVQEKYKNDPQKAQMEVMEIYRREKINPLGGCLPVLIQMPFFYALVQVLWRAQFLQGQSFLWIKDLTQPDRLMVFSYTPFYFGPLNLIYVDNELNILPILSGILMFLQQKLSSKNMPVVDEQQARSQKMMVYMMPAMMMIFFYRFSSGWAMYFVAYYLCTTLTQWKIARAAGK